MWVDARALRVAALDEVTVQLGESEVAGSVFIAPEQMILAPARVDGTILEVQRWEMPDEECGDLPGSDMPYLGSTIQVGEVSGTVTAIDAVRRLATVTCSDGNSVEIAVDRGNGADRTPTGAS